MTKNTSTRFKIYLAVKKSAYLLGIFYTSCAMVSGIALKGRGKDNQHCHYHPV